MTVLGNEYTHYTSSHPTKQGNGVRVMPTPKSIPIINSGTRDTNTRWLYIEADWSRSGVLLTGPQMHPITYPHGPGATMLLWAPESQLPTFTPVALKVRGIPLSQCVVTWDNGHRCLWRSGAMRTTGSGPGFCEAGAVMTSCCQLMGQPPRSVERFPSLVHSMFLWL